MEGQITQTETNKVFCIVYEKEKGITTNEIIEDTHIIKALERFYQKFPNNRVIGIKDNTA